MGNVNLIQKFNLGDLIELDKMGLYFVKAVSSGNYHELYDIVKKNGNHADFDDYCNDMETEDWDIKWTVRNITTHKLKLISRYTE